MKRRPAPTPGTVGNDPNREVRARHMGERNKARPEFL